MNQQPKFTLKLLHPKQWPIWIMLGLLWCLAHLPYRLQMALGKGLGLLAHKLVWPRRRVAEVNIALCFPELSKAEQATLVRQTFMEAGMGLMETMIAWFRPANYLWPKTEFKGLEHVHAAQANGQGVMILGAHFSTLDLAGALTSNVLDVSISYRVQNNAVMNYAMERNRARLYKDCFTRRDIRNFIRTLKTGNILWYTQDQDWGVKNGAFVDFFGVPAATITATSRIAKAGNAAVLPISFFRKPNGAGYEITIYPPINVPSGDDVADAKLINEFVEREIRRYPAQYLWLHKRFKTRPDNEPRGSLYKKKKN